MAKTKRVIKGGTVRYSDMPWKPTSQMTNRELDELCAGLRAEERADAVGDWVCLGLAVACVVVAVGPWMMLAWSV